MKNIHGMKEMKRVNSVTEKMELYVLHLTNIVFTLKQKTNFLDVIKMVNIKMKMNIKHFHHL